MNLAVHPSLNKLDVLRGRDRDWLLIVIEPSVRVAGLEISKRVRKSEYTYRPAVILGQVSPLQIGLPVFWSVS